MKFTFTTFVASYCVAFCSISNAKPTLIHDSDALNAKVYRLENGLTVYLSKNSQKPRFYAEFAVRCGSRHDPPNATGMAHYLEHLMFKGTEKLGTIDFSKEKPHLDKITALYEQHSQETDPEKRKEIYKQINAESLLSAKYAVPNEIDRLYKLIGGTGVNAHCSLEETVYKVNLPANEFERWAKIESERFTKPVFRLFHTELETVYEEKNRSLDNGDRQLFAKLQRSLYPKHPYGETTLGREEHLKNPSIKALYKHHSAYYVPSNMAVFVSGDIDINHALDVIDSNFGKWESAPAPKHVEQASEPLKGIKRIQVKFEGDEKVVMAWKTVKKHHPDYPALAIMDMILDNQVAGLINQNLVKQQKVRSAGSYPYVLNEAGAQYFYASPRQGQSLADLEKLLLSQINLVKEGKFSDWIISAIKKDLKIRDQEKYESNESRVEIMRDSFLSREDWNYTTQAHARFAKVTRADVIHVANKYFGDDYIVAEMLKGKPEVKLVDKPKIDPVPIDSTKESAFAKAINALQTTPISLEKALSSEKSMDLGGSIYHTVENPMNDLFSVTRYIPKGMMQDNRIMLALDLLEKSGTDKHTPKELNELWYKLGVTTSFSVAENSTTLNISGPARSYAEAVKAFDKWLDKVIFDEKTLKKLISDTKLNRQDSRQNPRTILHALARHSRFGKESKYHKALSTEQLDRLTTKDLKQALWDLLITPQQEVSYVGKLKSEDWKKHLRPRGGGAKVIELKKRPVNTPKEAIRIDFYHREMAQAQVWIETHTPNWDVNKLPYLYMFDEYFGGGMSSLVFQELREARGLAYSAYGYMAEPRHNKDVMVTIGYIGCQADKTVEAIDKFLELFDKMPESETRFKEAKDAVLNTLRSERIGFRSKVPTLIDWKRKGYKGDPRRMIYKTAEKMTYTDFLTFYKKNLQNLPKRINIVGDKNRIDLESLKKLGIFRELKDEDIFVQ